MGAGQYSALARVTDPNLKAAFKLLLDRIAILEGQASGIGGVSRALSTDLDAGGKLLRQVADPADPLDAVNLQTLQQYIEGVLSGALTAPPPRPIPGSGTTPGGGSTVNVPNVVGQTQANATASITHGFLILGTVTSAPSTTIASGIVIGQSPAANTVVRSGSAVNITVSSGPPGAGAVAVPNVIGLTSTAAQTAITTATLTVGGISVQVSTATAGTVIGQDPVAGALVVAATPVSIVVAVANSGPGTGNIRIAGKTFRNPDGSIFMWKSATDFRLYQYYLDGTDITPVLANRTGSGANMVRVLGMYSGAIGVFDPSTYPTYYSSLPAFAQLLASRGLNLEFVVFADAQNLTHFNEFSEQVNQLNAVVAALSPEPNVVLELANEAFQNGVTPSSHTKPSTIISAAGSGQDESPDLPPWDYATFHAPRDSEWPRKSHNAMEIANLLGRPVINDEPMGAAEVAIPGSRSDVPDDFYYFAAVGMLLAGGGTFHADDGIQSVVWRPVQQACATSFYAALAAITPLDITVGAYTRGPQADCPIQHTDALALRTYARYTATQAIAVVVRPAAAWVAIAVAPWVIDSQTGPNGCVVYLHR